MELAFRVPTRILKKFHVNKKLCVKPVWLSLFSAYPTANAFLECAHAQTFFHPSTQTNASKTNAGRNRNKHTLRTVSCICRRYSESDRKPSWTYQIDSNLRLHTAAELPDVQYRQVHQPVTNHSTRHNTHQKPKKQGRRYGAYASN